MSKPNTTKFHKGLKRMALTAGAALFMAGLAQAQPAISTELNGRMLNFDQPPIMEQGRVMVPLRGIFEELGANVLYDSARRQIKATNDGRTVELTLGQRQAFIDGRQVWLDVPADTISGRTMVPLRFVSEAMGADVKWRAASKTVEIAYDSSDMAGSGGQDSNQSADNQAPIEIDQLVHNGRSTLNQGDTLTVTMLGDRNAQASFSILGAVNDIPMNEVTPGRYEGQLRVTRGMSVNQGTLVARLRKGEQETLKEAPRAVTIAADQSTPVTNDEVAAMMPRPDSTIFQTQPTVQVLFPDQIRSGTATFTVDGRDYRPAVGADNRTATFTPSSALGAGTHRVEVQAVDSSGRLMAKSWNFTVSPQAVSDTQRPSVNVTNLRNGLAVPAVFNIQGQTTPYTKVSIDATTQRQVIPGVLGVRGRTIETSTVSDAAGRFDVQLNTGGLPSDSRIQLEVSVAGNDGQVSDQVELELVRQ